MIDQERQSGEGPQHQIAALKDAVINVRETQITAQAVSTLFGTSYGVAHGVMGLPPLAATVFAMRFGTAILAEAQTPYSAGIGHADGSETTFALTTHSELPQTAKNYIGAHFNFNPLENYRYRGKLTDELRSRFATAGISGNYLDDIAHVAFEMASDITPFDFDLQLKGNHGIDEGKLTVVHFQDNAHRIPQRPGFVLDEDTYPQFMEETSEWLLGRFREVLDNVVTGKYLQEQEQK